jgi:hypothetical protein
MNRAKCFSVSLSHALPSKLALRDITKNIDRKKFLTAKTTGRSRWPCGLRRRSAVGIPLGTSMSIVSVVCCQVEVSATGRSLIQSSPTECVCVSLSVIKCKNNPLHLQWVRRRGQTKKEKKLSDEKGRDSCRYRKRLGLNMHTSYPDSSKCLVINLPIGYVGWLLLGTSESVKTAICLHWFIYYDWPNVELPWI